MLLATTAHTYMHTCMPFLTCVMHHAQVASRKAAALKAAHDLPVEPEWATALDTKGPEIRTAMLREGKKLALKAGQTVIVEAVGDR